MIRNILVPLDGSKFGEHALPWALSLAGRSKATIHLVHIQLPVTAAYARLTGSVIEPYTEVIRKQNEGYLASVNKQISEVSPATVQTRLLEGDVCDTLSHFAEEIQADMILMTTHGRGALGRFWLGSVADRMVRVSPVPLMLVRPSLTPLDLKQECTVKHALVPLDGTTLAEAILPRVVPLCQAWGAKMTLLRLIEPLHTRLEHQMMANIAPTTPPLKEELERIEKLHMDEAEKYLQGVIDRLKEQEVKVATKVLMDDSPGPAILKLAEDEGMDLIAMETHGRRGLSRLFMGSVADKVIRGTHNPVLVHRPGTV